MHSNSHDTGHDAAKHAAARTTAVERVASYALRPFMDAVEKRDPSYLAEDLRRALRDAYELGFTDGVVAQAARDAGRLARALTLGLASEVR